MCRCMNGGLPQNNETEDFSKFTEQELIDAFTARARSISQGRGENPWRNADVLKHIAEEISKRWNQVPAEVIDALSNSFGLARDLFPENDFDVAARIVWRFNHTNPDQMEKRSMVRWLERLKLTEEQWYLLSCIAKDNEARVTCLIQVTMGGRAFISELTI